VLNQQLEGWLQKQHKMYTIYIGNSLIRALKESRYKYRHLMAKHIKLSINLILEEIQKEVLCAVKSRANCKSD
jgi:hypothetical protein